MDKDRTLELLKSIHDVQTTFIEEASPREVFDNLLAKLLSLTESEYGFIGEIQRKPDGLQYLKTHAITNIAWDDATRAFYSENAPQGLEFNNLDTLFGAVIRTKKAVISNGPEGDPRSGGRPDGHPPLRAFLGLPLFFGSEMIGMVGVANRALGYDGDVVDFLRPFITTCANIIRAHRNASERRVAEGALAASESRFRRLFEANIIGVVFADTGGSFSDANDAFLAMVGYERDDLPLRWDEMTPPEWSYTDRRALRQLQQHGIAEPWEKEYFRKDGSRIPIIVGMAFLEGSREKVIGFVLDLSKRKQMEAEQRDLRERLRQSQKMEAIGTVAAGIAHDFNNLLTAIRGWVDLANVTTPTGSDTQRSLTEIEVAISRGVDLTHTLLTFSRTSSSEKRPIDVAQLIRDSSRMLGAMMPASIELSVNAPGEDDCCWVLANATEMQQIIINLTVNARDAMPEGGALTLRVGREHLQDPVPNGRIVISVHDAGMGMDKTTLKKIFDPFFTTKPRGRGTGLGMSLVHGIVNDHSGSIDVQSEQGVGTTISITLPSCDSPPAEELTDTPPKRRGHGEAVLVAEDDPQVRAVICLTLAASGYEPIDVADGAAALEMMNTRVDQIRLAILDVDMPRLDGLECLAEIRKVNASVPVIIISGFHLPDISEWQDSNVCFVPKPLRADELTRMVGDILVETVSANETVSAKS